MCAGALQGGGGVLGSPPGKISKNEAKSCILSEKKEGSGHPGIHTGHAPVHCSAVYTALLKTSSFTSVSVELFCGHLSVSGPLEGLQICDSVPAAML